MMASPPPWLAELANRVAELMCPVDMLSPLGCHYHHVCFPQDQWEITLFAGKTEIVGGPADGARVSSPFTLDLEQLISIFSEITSFHWQALAAGSKEDLGSHISLEGYYQGHSVWLRVLAKSPKRFRASRYAHVMPDDLVLQDLW